MCGLQAACLRRLHYTHTFTTFLEKTDELSESIETQS